MTGKMSQVEGLHLGYALVGGLAVLLAFVSRAIRNFPISEPLLALALGILVGPAALDLLDISDHDRPVLTLEASRLLLAISVMAVALRYPARDLRSVIRPVAVLITVGMVAMAALTAGVAALFFGLPIAVAALFGACVSPTDPVLAASVVTGEPAERDLPVRTRQILSAESGANDGLAFPLVIITLAVAVGDGLGTSTLEAVYGVVGAVAIGVVVGGLAGKAVERSLRGGEADQGTMTVFTLFLALAALGLARLAEVGGVLAVFVTGLAYNATVARRERGPQQSIDEAVNRYLLLPLFLLLGIELPWEAWGRLGWTAVLFPLAVLLLRRLPVLLALARPLALSWRDALFLGWFGPIGVSALFYLSHAEEHGATQALWTYGSLMVFASTVAHGISSTPGRKAYASAAERASAVANR